MTDRQQIAKREAQTPSARGGQDVQRVQETIYVPDVDIREDSECIRLEANMPGVGQESVAVSVENGVLTIEGLARIDGPQGYKLVGQEYGVGRYRRDFTLSDAVDAEGIKARMCQGVLDVTLPKHDKVKTRKIEIET
jgi:HSP20 family protein